MEYTLFEHQNIGVEFLSNHKGAILADEMGLGKTRQAIVAGGRVSDSLNVIVCPASLKLNWEREIKQVFPEDVIYTSVKSATPAAVKKVEAMDPAWLIINYEQLSKWMGLLLGRKYTLIGDEAHYIKASSARAKYFLLLAENAERVWLLTGTPVLNRPIELFNLLKAIGHPLGAKKGEFATRYCGAVAMASVVDKENGFRQFLVHASKSHGYRYNPKRYRVRYFTDMRGATNIPELREKIDDVFLRRTKEEVLDLPEKIVQRVEVPMERVYRDQYDTAFDSYIEFLKENPMEGKDIDNIMLAKHLVELQKLKQVCSYAKVDRVVEDVARIADSSGSVVIFTQYRETLWAIKKALGPIYGEANVYVLDGSTPIPDREKAVRNFQGSTVPAAFVGNIKAAGVGITLTASTNVVFADMEWTPALHEQAADRCHRIGQTGTVNVRYYVALDTLEEDIMDMLARKAKVVAGVLAGEDVDSSQSGVADVLESVVHRVGLL